MKMQALKAGAPRAGHRDKFGKQEAEAETTFLRFGEFFSGPGGLSLGAKKSCAGNLAMKHAWALDYHEDTCNTYRRNICPASPESVICGDVRDVDFTKLSDVDAFLFGFPCNDFSNVGETKGMRGAFGPLYQNGARLIAEKKPIFFVAENVAGLLSSNGGRDMKLITRDLTDLGYVVTVHLYSFEKYGVPQNRKRVVFVGMRADLGLEFKVPAPFEKVITAGEAISNPPIVEGYPNHDFMKQSATVVERLKHIKQGQNAWNADLPPHLRLNVKGARLSHIYRRLEKDKPAYTLTASGGGGTHVYHWEEDRALTNRERARLQTFPDDFVFEGSRESVRRQIGMAVPPAGAQVIIESALKTISGINYPSVSASEGVYYPE